MTNWKPIESAPKERVGDKLTMKYDVCKINCTDKVVRVTFYYKGEAIYYEDHPFFNGMVITYPYIDGMIEVSDPL